MARLADYLRRTYFPQYPGKTFLSCSDQVVTVAKGRAHAGQRDPSRLMLPCSSVPYDYIRHMMRRLFLDTYIEFYAGIPEDYGVSR